MLRPTLAIKVVGGVIGALVLAGGGVAVATVSNPTHLSTPETSESPDNHGHDGQHNEDDGLCPSPAAQPATDLSDRDSNEPDGADCDANDDHGDAKDGSDDRSHDGSHDGSNDGQNDGTHDGSGSDHHGSGDSGQHAGGGGGAAH